MDKVLRKEDFVSNFSHALFSVLDFLNLEDGTDMLSRNFGRNYNSMLHDISQERRSQMMIWQCRPWFGSAWYGSELVHCFIHKFKMI